MSKLVRKLEDILLLKLFDDSESGEKKKKKKKRKKKRKNKNKK